MMRTPLLLAALGALTLSGGAVHARDLVGEYQLRAGPDAVGGLIVQPDGRFKYGLMAGSLDEGAEGRWERQDDAVCLFTEPVPIAPAFIKVAPREIDGAIPTVLVTWPNGRGIAGIDFTIRFDEGDPIEDYTQSDGWTMPPEDGRVPRTIAVHEPVHRITALPFLLDTEDEGKLHVQLVPNDFGVPHFDGACLKARGDIFVLQRSEGEMPFVRVGN